MDLPHSKERSRCVAKQLSGVAIYLDGEGEGNHRGDLLDKAGDCCGGKVGGGIVKRAHPWHKLCRLFPSQGCQAEAGVLACFEATNL